MMWKSKYFGIFVCLCLLSRKRFIPQFTNKNWKSNRSPIQIDKRPVQWRGDDRFRYLFVFFVSKWHWNQNCIQPRRTKLCSLQNSQLFLLRKWIPNSTVRPVTLLVTSDFLWSCKNFDFTENWLGGVEKKAFNLHLSGTFNLSYYGFVKVTHPFLFFCGFILIEISFKIRPLNSSYLQGLPKIPQSPYPTTD